jgi:hypothetical protein
MHCAATARDTKPASKRAGVRVGYAMCDVYKHKQTTAAGGGKGDWLVPETSLKTTSLISATDCAAIARETRANTKTASKQGCR